MPIAVRASSILNSYVSGEHAYNSVPINNELTIDYDQLLVDIFRLLSSFQMIGFAC